MLVKKKSPDIFWRDFPIPAQDTGLFVPGEVYTTLSAFLFEPGILGYGRDLSLVRVLVNQVDSPGRAGAYAEPAPDAS